VRGESERVRSQSGQRQRPDGHRAAVPELRQVEQELIVALEAALREERERTTELETRVELIEQRLAAASPVAAAHPPSANQTKAPAAAVPTSIDSCRWDEADEETYWLRRCEGFRLCDSSGVLGVVDSVRFGHDLDRPETLIVVARRRWRRRRFEVAASELAEISPDQQQITLAVPARDWLLPTASRRHRPSKPRFPTRNALKH
jgi:hypothetical protein